MSTIAHGAAGRQQAFFALAAAVGVVYANVTVGVPLQLEQTGRSAAAAGQVLAAGTLAIVLGAGIAGTVSARAGGLGRALIVAVAGLAAGCSVLLLSASLLALFVGSTVCGAAHGVFWVACQRRMGRTSGWQGSEHAFLRHYASYTAGTMIGAFGTGVLFSALDGAPGAGLRGVYGLSLVACVCGALLWLPHAIHEPDGQASRRIDLRVLSRGAWLQLPDILLVGALSMLVPLAPLILYGAFELSPFAIGSVMAGVGAAKVLGTTCAGLVSSARGPSVTIVAMLTAGIVLTLALTVIAAVGDAVLFVAVFLGVVVVLTGAWPVVVDAAQARRPPDQRRGFAVSWNIREYGAISAMTFATGWILASVEQLEVLFLIASVLLGASVLAAVATLRRPTYGPCGESS